MENDYELLYLANENNEYAIEKLYNKYKGLIYYKVLRINPKPSEIEDYLNEANLAFYKAINSYNDSNRFITFLNICLDRALQNYQKKKINNISNSIDIDENFIDSDNTYNPERIIIEEEECERLRTRILKSLNYKEELVFILREQNFTYKEISQILDSNIEKIYKTIKTIRKKVNKLLLQ